VVVDETGLGSHFDFDLRYAPDVPNSDAPSIFTALGEQLGLKLAPRKMRVEVITVEHAESPTEN
jgi:uncharacterized protein (TIGR03435 family)